MDKEAPLKLPTGVDWNGSSDAFIAFMTAVFNNCPNTRSSCGGLPKNCSLCAILCNQHSLDLMVYAWETRKHWGEFKEVDRVNFVVVRLDREPPPQDPCEDIW